MVRIKHSLGSDKNSLSKWQRRAVGHSHKAVISSRRLLSTTTPTTFYTMNPNLSFHTGNIPRTFHIRTYKDNNPSGQLMNYNTMNILNTFNDTLVAVPSIREITLYLEYSTNDINR